MKKHDLYMKVVFTLMALCIFIGFSIILYYSARILQWAFLLSFWLY